VKHIYRFEPNPFIPELALQMSNLTRLANYLRSDEYREIYQNYFLNFDDNETKEITKKTNKKNKIIMLKNKMFYMTSILCSYQIIICLL